MHAFDLEAYRAQSLPTEEQIISAWHEKGTPRVSVICNTYNHTGLIEDALRGFVLQRTTFPFEVVVHDDASTDGTSAIVAEWCSRYPRIFKHILQVVNQFSSGIKPTPLAIPHTKGEFIALCEGDDFWPHSEKLQLQFEVLRQNPNFSICSSSGFVLRENDLLEEPCVERVLTHHDILAGAKRNCRTCSMMIRRSCLPVEWPRQMTEASAGDNFVRALATRAGDVFVLPIRLSCYRVHERGSWSQLRGDQLAWRRLRDMELLSQIVDADAKLLLRCRAALLILVKRLPQGSVLDRLRAKARSLALLISHPLVALRILRIAS